MVHRHASDVLLYGEEATADFPWELFGAKWNHRLEPEEDDWRAAPNTGGTLCWEEGGVERKIPWIVLKSVWRNDKAPLCPNCDTPLVVLRFLWALPIMFSGIRTITHGCFGCRREWVTWTDDFWDWLLTRLDRHLLPTHQWGTRKIDIRNGHPFSRHKGR